MCLGAVCSCVGTACAGCCCSALSDCKVKHGPGSRIPYIFIMFLLCIYAVIMQLYGDTEIWSNDLLNIDITVCDADENEACAENGSVYRVSFCLFVFFVIHTAVVKAVASFHWLFFIIKLFCLIGVLAATYFIPLTGFFNAYAEFARVASIIFLLLQVVILISWAYETNDRVVDKVNEVVDKVDDEETRRNKAELCCIQFGLIFATLIIYIAIIIFIVLQYGWFTPRSSCTFNSTILGLMIVFILIMTVLPVVLATKHSSIFVAGVVSFYVTYLGFAGLENNPDTDCNELAQDDSVATMWVGIIITTIAICYVGFSVSNKRGVLTGGDDRSDEINMELEAGTNTKKAQSEGDDAGTSNYDDDADLGDTNYDDAKPVKKSRKEPDVSDDAVTADQKDNVMFHLCMAFASVYMAMLYTNWGEGSAFGTDQGEIRSMTAVWINIAAQWTTVVLFTWTQVAPKVCPGRFGEQIDDE